MTSPTDIDLIEPLYAPMDVQIAASAIAGMMALRSIGMLEISEQSEVKFRIILDSFKEAGVADSDQVADYLYAKYITDVSSQ